MNNCGRPGGQRDNRGGLFVADPKNSFMTGQPLTAWGGITAIRDKIDFLNT